MFPLPLLLQGVLPKMPALVPLRPDQRSSAQIRGKHLPFPQSPLLPLFQRFCLSPFQISVISVNQW